MHLYDLVDVDEANELMLNGYLNEQFHPTEPLAILNYSKLAVPGAECWKVESLHHCRGLIYNTDNGEIVARPFKKFWNYGEPGAAQIPLAAKVQVLDKVDGSLGILYREPNSGQLAIATRGSFTSDQAVHATAILRERYADFEPDRDWTYLFEIVYPENRIVLDYGDRDDLVLLGGVWDRTAEDGPVLGPEGFPEWKGPKVEIIFEGPFSKALALPRDRQNAEGYVIRRLQNDDTVKLKQEDYVTLHRIRYGLNQKSVYGAFIVGRGLDQPGQFDQIMFDELRESAPEEFWPWIDAQARWMRGWVALRSDEIRAEYDAIRESVDWLAISEEQPSFDSANAALDALRRANNKAFAAEVAKLKTKNAWGLFLLWQGKGDAVEDALWIALGDEVTGKVGAVIETKED